MTVSPVLPPTAAAAWSTASVQSTDQSPANSNNEVAEFNARLPRQKPRLGAARHDELRLVRLQRERNTHGIALAVWPDMG